MRAHHTRGVCAHQRMTVQPAHMLMPTSGRDPPEWRAIGDPRPFFLESLPRSLAAVREEHVQPIHAGPPLPQTAEQAGPAWGPQVTRSAGPSLGSAGTGLQPRWLEDLWSGTWWGPVRCGEEVADFRDPNGVGGPPLRPSPSLAACPLGDPGSRGFMVPNCRGRWEGQWEGEGPLTGRAHAHGQSHQQVANL